MESEGRDASEAATALGGSGDGMVKTSEAPKSFGRGWLTSDTLVFEEVFEEVEVGAFELLRWRGSF